MKNCEVFVFTLLLGGLWRCGEAQVTITRPPEDTTVCRGSNVTISCGYSSGTALPVTWIINETLFTQEDIVDSPLYQLNSPTSPMGISITVISINGTTAFQCRVHSTPHSTSTLGTVTVIGRPKIEITTTGGCEYIFVSLLVSGNNNNINEDNMCGIYLFDITLSSMDTSMTVVNSMLKNNFTELPGNDTLYNVTVIGVDALEKFINVNSTSVVVERPIPVMVAVKVTFNIDLIALTVSWKVTTGCTANIIVYNITVMDQYSPASVTVPANMLSVEISEFPGNGTSIVANREYTITVSAISDQGGYYPSDPVVINTFILQDCTVTSPSIGTIRVSCDSSHQILVTLTCTNNCNNPMVTSNGSSPLTVRGLDLGMMYSVIINVFDGNQVVFSNQMVIKTITVMNDESDIEGGDNGDSGGSNAGAIAGGVIGGIIAVVVIVIIFIVIYYFGFYRSKDSTYDDTANLKSPTGTGGSHTSGGTGTISVTNSQYDKVEYAAPAQTLTIPHQSSTTGQEYAVSAKAAKKTSQEQPPTEKYNSVHATKKDSQEIQYADLQDMPADPNRKSPTFQDPAVTYSQIA